MNRAAGARSRGFVEIDAEECKGCGLCVEACPLDLLHLDDCLNRYGYRTAHYAGDGCSGCGICYYVCPEPGGVTVYEGRSDGPRSAGALIPPQHAILVVSR